MEIIQNPDVMKALAKKLQQASAQNLSQTDVADLVKKFVHGYHLLGMTRSHNQIWYRARVCQNNEVFDNVHQMIYPSNGSPSFNRASFPKSRVLYAGWNTRLALEEIGAKAGDTVQLISLRVKPSIQFPCAIIGEYQAIFNSGRSIVNSEKTELGFLDMLSKSPDYAYSQIFVDSVIAEIFRAKSNINEDYLVSATIAENFILMKAQGLMYPSVRTAHSVNLAVRSDEFDINFEVLDTTVFKVKDYHGYGLYALEPLRYTCEILSDGHFVWDSKRVMTSTWGPRRDEQIPADFIGWRMK